MPGPILRTPQVYLHLGRRLAATIPVYDHAGSLLFHADRPRAIELMSSPEIDTIATKKRIKSLHFRGPDPSGLTGGSRYRRQMGMPHRNENYYNLAGVWHIDRIPDWLQPHYLQVVMECIQ